MISLRKVTVVLLATTLVYFTSSYFEISLQFLCVLIGALPLIIHICLSSRGRYYFDPFSPLHIFPATYGLVYGLGALRYVNENDPTATRIVTFALMGIACYMAVASIVFSRTLAISSGNHTIRNKKEAGAARIVLVALLSSSLLAAIYMVSKVGMPFLYEDKLDARLAARDIVSSNVIYIMRTSFIGFYIYLACTLNENHKLTNAKTAILVSLFALICFINIIPGWRGPIFLFAFNSAMIVHYRYAKLNLTKAATYGGLLVLAMLAWGFVRVIYNPNELLIITELYAITDSILVIFLLWSAYQFSVYTLGFKTVLEIFSSDPHLLGGVFLMTASTLAPGKQDTLGELIKERGGFDFAGAGLNPTILGDAYADFGAAGIAIYMALSSFILCTSYKRMRRTPSPKNTAIYAYLTTCFVLGSLTGILSQASYTFHLLVLGASLFAIRIIKKSA